MSPEPRKPFHQEFYDKISEIELKDPITKKMETTINFDFSKSKEFSPSKIKKLQIPKLISHLHFPTIKNPVFFLKRKNINFD